MPRKPGLGTAEKPAKVEKVVPVETPEVAPKMLYGQRIVRERLKEMPTGVVCHEVLVANGVTYLLNDSEYIKNVVQ